MSPDMRQLYTRCAPALLRKCERLLGNRPDAEDVVQQLFMDLMRRGRSDVDLPYLYRAATNRCLNRMRDHARRRDLLDQHGVGLLHPAAPRIDDQLLHQDLLVQLVDALDERAAEIMVLHFVDGIDQGEVAAMIGVSRRTVVKHVGRIRDRARTLGEGGGP